MPNMASSPFSLLLPLCSTCGTSPSFAIPQSILVEKLPRLVVRVKSSERGECASLFNCNSRRDFLGLSLGVSSLFIHSFDANGAGLPPEEKPKLCDHTCEKELENELFEKVLCDYYNTEQHKIRHMLPFHFKFCESLAIELYSHAGILTIEVPMVTTESGLQYKDIRVGQGPSPPVGFQVAANYVAMVPSGQIFDSSLEKGQPYIFRVGSGQVIKGLDEGILSMKIGGKRRLYIPGTLAFPKGLTSAPGRPRVAPNSPVIFDVSLEYIPGLEADEE